MPVSRSDTSLSGLDKENHKITNHVKKEAVL